MFKNNQCQVALFFFLMFTILEMLRYFLKFFNDNFLIMNENLRYFSFQIAFQGSTRY